MPTKNQFKDRLIAAREGAGLSQTALAKLAGMAPTQLARYEIGRAVPRRAATARLAKALCVNSQWLAGTSDGPDDAEVLVQRDPQGNVEITFRSDAETAERWRKIAASKGMTEDELFGWAVRQLAAESAAAPPRPTDAVLKDVLARLARLEDRASWNEAGKPKPGE